MTKAEAIACMKSGKKVTHRHFSDHEWITMQGNIYILTEDGYSISAEDFWRYRTGEAFEIDWCIYDDTLL